MSETETTALEVIPRDSALAVLTNAEKFDEFFERVAKEVRGVEPDLTTAAGRKAVAALAFKVTKSKTAIVAAADLLTEDARAQIAKVNASKKEIEERLDALKKEVRKPLTDWEAAEEKRQERADLIVESLRRAAIVPLEADSAWVADQLGWLDDADILVDGLNEETLRDFFPIAVSLREAARDALRTAAARIAKAEADAAELATLRARNEERDREDQKRRDAEAAAEQERQAEAQRRRDEEDQRERDRIAAEEAAEAARVAEEQRAARERQIAEEAAAAERQRIADFAESERQAAEKRAANVRHQTKIKGEAKVAIIETMNRDVMPEFATPEIREAIAVAIVRAIVGGQVPHVTITF